MRPCNWPALRGRTGKRSWCQRIRKSCRRVAETCWHGSRYDWDIPSVWSGTRANMLECSPLTYFVFFHKMGIRPWIQGELTRQQVNSSAVIDKSTQLAKLNLLIFTSVMLRYPCYGPFRIHLRVVVLIMISIPSKCHVFRMLRRIWAHDGRRWLSRCNRTRLVDAFDGS